MTPKEKALKLVSKMCLRDCSHENIDNSIKRSIICVDEIIEFMKVDDEYTETASNANSKRVGYWQDVKKELLKL